MRILETPSLTIREFRLSDALALQQLNSNKEVLRYVLNPLSWTMEDAENYIRDHRLLYERYGFGRWAVTEKSKGEVIGWCGLKYKPEYGHVDLGYRFMPQYWNKGFATETTAACINYGFSELGLHRIVASFVPGNSVSQHILEKNGMNNCGYLKIGNVAYPLMEKFNPARNGLRKTPHIETERLALREMHLSDARVMLALNADPEVVMYTGDKPFNSLEETKTFFRERINAYDEMGYGRWIVVLKETGETLGWCGLKLEDNETDLGYRFFKRNWNKGYATEAAEACLHYGFHKLGLKRIVARAMKLNVGSIRVLEKCGMKFIGEKVFALHAGVVYEKLRS